MQLLSIIINFSYFQSPSSDSGSINDEGDINEPESESTDGNSLPASSTPGPIVAATPVISTASQSALLQDTAKMLNLEHTEPGKMQLQSPTDFLPTYLHFQVTSCRLLQVRQLYRQFQ